MFSNDDPTDTFLRNKMSSSEGIFAIKGDLDGADNQQDFSDVLQFIGLLVGKEEFFFPIEAVNEIVMLNKITYVPRGPQFTEGVINLRGHILPAINLRVMMGLTKVDPTPASRIIICKYEDINIGLLVDGISYVTSLHSNEIERHNLPTKGQGSELIEAISKRGQTVNGILDISKIILTLAGGKLETEDSEQEEAA